MTPSRLGAAFSLRDGLRALFVPSASHLRPLDGLRALSVMWVIVFHAAWYSIRDISSESYVHLLAARWMLPIWRGDFGVDVFFVISGFLVAGLLIDELERTGTAQLGRFYARRVLRLWPGLVAAVAIDQLLIHEYPGTEWASLLYVTDFVSVGTVCMAWTWSLAIEEQFYLLCPHLVRALRVLSPRERYGVVAAILLMLTAIAAAVVVRGGFHAPDAEIVVNRTPSSWMVAFDALYAKPWMRGAPLVAGVGAAFLFRSPRVMAALGDAQLGALIGLALALMGAVLSTHWQWISDSSRVVEVAYLSTFRMVFGLAVAYLALFTLSAHPLGRWLGRLLSSPALHPVAQVSYVAYLLNPIVAMRVHAALAPSVAQSSLSPMAWFIPADLAVTLLAAAVLHVVVERPFMQLRPRAA